MELPLDASAVEDSIKDSIAASIIDENQNNEDAAEDYMTWLWDNCSGNQLHFIQLGHLDDNFGITENTHDEMVKYLLLNPITGVPIFHKFSFNKNFNPDDERVTPLKRHYFYMFLSWKMTQLNFIDNTNADAQSDEETEGKEKHQHDISSVSSI